MALQQPFVSAYENSSEILAVAEKFFKYITEKYEEPLIEGDVFSMTCEGVIGSGTNPEASPSEDKNEK